MIVEFNYRSFQTNNDKEHIEFTAFRDCKKILMRSVDANNSVHDFTPYVIDMELVKKLFSILDQSQEDGEWDQDVLDDESKLPLTEIEMTFTDGRRYSYLCHGFNIPRKEEIVGIIKEVFKVQDNDKLFAIFN